MCILVLDSPAPEAERKVVHMMAMGYTAELAGALSIDPIDLRAARARARSVLASGRKPAILDLSETRAVAIGTAALAILHATRETSGMLDDWMHGLNEVALGIAGDVLTAVAREECRDRLSYFRGHPFQQLELEPMDEWDRENDEVRIARTDERLLVGELWDQIIEPLVTVLLLEDEPSLWTDDALSEVSRAARPFHVKEVAPAAVIFRSIAESNVGVRVQSVAQ